MKEWIMGIVMGVLISAFSAGFYYYGYIHGRKQALHDLPRELNRPALTCVELKSTL